jgi:hypothetical protein
MQYILMLVSGGNPSTAKDIQVKVAAARKVFRIMKVLPCLHLEGIALNSGCCWCSLHQHVGRANSAAMT